MKTIDADSTSLDLKRRPSKVNQTGSFLGMAWKPAVFSNGKLVHCWELKERVQTTTGRCF